jgi:hypothetical protein
MPGMGMIASLREAAADLKHQGMLATTLVRLDDLRADSMGLGFDRSMKTAKDFETATLNAPVVIVDVDHGPTSPEEHKFLVALAQQNTGASLWIVGGNTDALAQDLPQAHRFQVAYRTQVRMPEAPTSEGTAPTPKPAGGPR